ncbi:MAG TPA: hypothetical protein VLL54_16255 [Pyrinomonadaceae bacterium]|nr:hypothetical protein [Pyrinomonadaceae bacterium]
MKLRIRLLLVAAAVAMFCSVPSPTFAQNQPTVLAGAELTRVVPPGFYFQGLTAPTQMRNSAAARLDANRYVIAGIVDTSGYSSDVRARYEGFLITDSKITVNGVALGIGAYGFGFTDDGKLNILDLAGNDVLSTGTTRDKGLKRPRPLMMSMAGNAIRLYSGRDYVVIAAQ